MATIASGYSFYTIVSDGTTDTYPLNFALGELKRTYVRVYVDGEVDGGGAQIYRQIEDVPGETGMVRVLGGVVPAGGRVNFQRIVPKDMLIHRYNNGSILDYPSLDESHDQLMMAMHEVLDGIGLKNVFTDINMNGFKITNIYTDLNDPNSVATVGSLGPYRDDAAASATAAAASATEAAASATAVKDFRNIYYGSRSSDPTTRPDGSAMQDGDLYKNTATTLRVYDAASGIWVDASTAVPISVKEFGAVGDGVTDDTAAFQSALDAGSRVRLYIPPGIYRLTSPVVSHNRNLTIAGAGKDVTVLVWDGATDGLVLTDDVSFSSNLRANFNLSGMTIATKGVGIGFGIRCSMPISINTPTVYGDASTLTLRDVDIRGYDQYESNQHYWIRGVFLEDTGGVCLDNVRILGTVAASGGSGVYIKATTAYNIRFMFTNLQINFVETAIVIEGNSPYAVEGIYLTNFELVACRFGVLVRGGPCHALELANGHIDTDAEVVKFESSSAGSSALSLSGCYLQRGAKVTGAPIAGFVIDASYCNRARIVSNYLLGDASVEHHGVLIDHSIDSIVALNAIHNVTGVGVSFGANSTGARGVLNNFTGTAVNYVFDGLNNYADDTNNASYISTAAGLTHAFGTAVLKLNANGEGYAPLPTPFKQGILSSVVCNGDVSAVPGAFGSTLSLCSTTAIHVRVTPNPGAIVVRVNYHAVGR